MLQKCTALFLLLAFLASTFSKAVIVADFYVNQDYIAKNLCENRDQPMKHCCGRCLLRKRLAREDNQEKNNPERRMDGNQEVLFFCEAAQGLTPPTFSDIPLSYALYRAKAPVDQAWDIFHPPA
jgi:hypothetical protein